MKLETIHGFYCPSSPEVLNQIIQEGFHTTFTGELTFSTYLVIVLLSLQKAYE